MNLWYPSTTSIHWMIRVDGSAPQSMHFEGKVDSPDKAPQIARDLHKFSMAYIETQMQADFMASFGEDANWVQQAQAAPDIPDDGKDEFEFDKTVERKAYHMQDDDIFEEDDDSASGSASGYRLSNHGFSGGGGSSSSAAAATAVVAGPASASGYAASRRGAGAGAGARAPSILDDEDDGDEDGAGAAGAAFKTPIKRPSADVSSSGLQSSLRKGKETNSVSLLWPSEYLPRISFPSQFAPTAGSHPDHYSHCSLPQPLSSLLTPSDAGDRDDVESLVRLARVAAGRDGLRRGRATAGAQPHPQGARCQRGGLHPIQAAAALERPPAAHAVQGSRG